LLSCDFNFFEEQLMNTRLAVLLCAMVSAGCGKDALKDAKDSLVNGGPSFETADKIEFVSEVSWLKDTAGKLDQAGLPWVMGAFLLTEKVGDVESVPVLFDADKDPEIKVGMKIEVAGSAQLNNRPKLTIFESAEQPVKPLKLTAVISSGDSQESFDKIPDSIPLVGGKTVVPLFFMIPMTSFDWSTAGEETKTKFKDAFDNGSLGDLTSGAGEDTPLPWLDCEPVKITLTIKKDQEPTEIQQVKYLAADPAAFLNLFGALADTAGPILKEASGFDIASIKSSLEALSPTECQPLTDAQKALFD
jgi:hypothetical protein